MEQLKNEGKTVFFSTHILSDAEALCDRVAVINKGELRGVGSISELTSTVQGKIEILWRGTNIPLAFKTMGAECFVTADSVRAIIPEQQQEAALEALQRDRLRLISLTPMRTSLEEYYLQKLQPTESSQSAAGGRA